VGEIDRILVGKFRWSHQQVSEALEDYLSEALNVSIAGVLHGVCRDPNDDMAFECSVNAHATLTVTSDKELIAVGTYRDSRVITVRRFLDGFVDSGA
jgi:predicted nucleic acid-binding protein